VVSGLVSVFKAVIFLAERLDLLL